MPSPVIVTRKKKLPWEEGFRPTEKGLEPSSVDGFFVGGVTGIVRTATKGIMSAVAGSVDDTTVGISSAITKPFSDVAEYDRDKAAWKSDVDSALHYGRKNDEAFGRDKEVKRKFEYYYDKTKEYDVMRYENGGTIPNRRTPAFLGTALAIAQAAPAVIQMGSDILGKAGRERRFQKGMAQQAVSENAALHENDAFNMSEYNKQFDVGYEFGGRVPLQRGGKSKLGRLINGAFDPNVPQPVVETPAPINPYVTRTDYDTDRLGGDFAGNGTNNAGLPAVNRSARPNTLFNGNVDLGAPGSFGKMNPANVVTETPTGSTLSRAIKSVTGIGRTASSVQGTSLTGGVAETVVAPAAQPPVATAVAKPKIETATSSVASVTPPVKEGIIKETPTARKPVIPASRISPVAPRTTDYTPYAIPRRNMSDLSGNPARTWKYNGTPTAPVNPTADLINSAEQTDPNAGAKNLGAGVAEITAKTKGKDVVNVGPNNPTGAVVAAGELTKRAPNGDLDVLSTKAAGGTLADMVKGDPNKFDAAFAMQEAAKGGTAGAKPNSLTFAGKLKSGFSDLKNEVKSMGAGDWADVANVAAPIMSSVFGIKAANKMVAPVAPTKVAPAQYQTRVNVQPQINASKRGRDASMRLAEENTVSSAARVARGNQAIDADAQRQAEIYGTKQNIEASLHNQGEESRARTDQYNSAMAYQHGTAVAGVKNQATMLKANAKINAVGVPAAYLRDKQAREDLAENDLLKMKWAAAGDSTNSAEAIAEKMETIDKTIGRITPKKYRLKKK